MFFAQFLHIAGFTIWVGGMFFAYMALRPIAASCLDAEPRLRLWTGVLEKFFFWVWLSVAAILFSGLYLMAHIGRPPVHVSIMFITGIIMMAIFAHVFFAPFQRLRKAVSANEWAAGASALSQIRTFVGINLILGLVTIATGSLGRMFL
ncbi:MAG TPA: CopD family protein [Noviherbaspirillum sp.]|nr:CopD family protein [Noviherbaspirillum sp.]